MKWTNKYKRDCIIGQTRIKEGWLWFPKRPQHSEETRWMEYAIWEEQLRDVSHPVIYKKKIVKWVCTQWLTEKNKINVR